MLAIWAKSFYKEAVNFLTMGECLVIRFFKLSLDSLVIGGSFYFAIKLYEEAI